MKDTQLLERAEACWNGLQDFRETRRRNINYIYGDQWGDLVVDEDGRLVTERERIARKTGGVPLQNNHLIKIVHALTGLIAKSNGQPVCYARGEGKNGAEEIDVALTDALQSNWGRNGMKDLMVSQMEELLQGGISVACEEWGLKDGEADAFTYTVNPDYFFFESKMSDPRLWDMGLIGEIRDYQLGELVSHLSHTHWDYDHLKRLYAPLEDKVAFMLQTAQSADPSEQMDFHHPPTNRLCRTYHVWTHEHLLRYRCIDHTDSNQPVYRIKPDHLASIKAENRKRQRKDGEKAQLIHFEPVYEAVWHFTLLAPDGTVLEHYDSPYVHGCHPYVMTAYHFVNGRIYPFMSTVIDQQRYINRLITLNDLYINTSIKGLKMIPKRTIPRDMSLEEFARQAMEVGGWIVYEPDPTGAKPEIITQNAQGLGVSEMLQLQIASINEITSVNESLQGVPPQGNTGYQRYAMEMENSSTSVAALTSKFLDFQRRLARRKMQVISQYAPLSPLDTAKLHVEIVSVN